MYNINDDIERVMVSAEKLDETVTRVAKEIDKDFPDPESKLLLLCILKGSVNFMGDLMKKINRPVEIDFMRVSSYKNATTSSGTVEIILDISRKDLSSIDIIIVEDIIDSGNTIAYLTKYLVLKGAKSVKVAALLDKPARRQVNFKADYVGLEIEDEFVVGYGLDYDEKYRALPYIGILKPRVYST